MMSLQWSWSRASTAMSRTSHSPAPSTMSMAPICPPARPIAEVTSPSVPGEFSSLILSVRLYEALGVSGIGCRLPDSRDARGLGQANHTFAQTAHIPTPDGRPTNAIFGFASMLVKILTEYGPKATVVVWDAGMSGREQQYEPYKAERKPRPDLLKEQWPQLEPLVEAFGYRNVRVEGYEADDVIASLAEQAKEKGIDVTVVTGDRDAYQLADDGRVRIMTTSRGITDTRLYDRDGVVERYGIGPELIPDFI